MVPAWLAVSIAAPAHETPPDTPPQQVTVTGKPAATQPGALKDDIVKTETINAREIEKSGATNLTELMSHRPGIDVQLECSICNVRNITLNSLPGRFTTLMLDGVPIFSPVSNAHGLDMRPPRRLDDAHVTTLASDAFTYGTRQRSRLKVSMTSSEQTQVCAAESRCRLLNAHSLGPSFSAAIPR